MVGSRQFNFYCGDVDIIYPLMLLQTTGFLLHESQVQLAKVSQISQDLHQVPVNDILSQLQIFTDLLPTQKCRNQYLQLRQTLTHALSQFSTLHQLSDSASHWLRVIQSLVSENADLSHTLQEFKNQIQNLAASNSLLKETVFHVRAEAECKLMSLEEEMSSRKQEIEALKCEHIDYRKSREDEVATTLYTQRLLYDEFEGKISGAREANLSLQDQNLFLQQLVLNLQKEVKELSEKLLESTNPHQDIFLTLTHKTPISTISNIRIDADDDDDSHKTQTPCSLTDDIDCSPCSLTDDIDCSHQQNSLFSDLLPPKDARRTIQKHTSQINIHSFLESNPENKAQLQKRERNELTASPIGSSERKSLSNCLSSPTLNKIHDYLHAKIVWKKLKKFKKN